MVDHKRAWPTLLLVLNLALLCNTTRIRNVSANCTANSNLTWKTKKNAQWKQIERLSDLGSSYVCWKKTTDQLTIKEEHSRPSITKKGIDMEKSKAPSFHWKTIDYPEFRRGWQRVAWVYWEDENQVEQIRFKVGDDRRCIIMRYRKIPNVSPPEYKPPRI